MHFLELTGLINLEVVLSSQDIVTGCAGGQSIE